MTTRTMWILVAVALAALAVWRPSTAGTASPLARAATPVAVSSLASASPYARTVFAFTFESRGFYRVPPHLRLVVTEWLPCLDVQRQLQNRRGSDAQAGTPTSLEFAVDNFLTDWRSVRSGVVVLGGETVHNPNDLPVRAFGYFVDPEEHLTDRDLAMIEQENTDAVLERLEEMQTILASRSQTQVEDSVIEILSRALHQSVVEHVEAERQAEGKKDGPTDVPRTPEQP